MMENDTNIEKGKEVKYYIARDENDETTLIIKDGVTEIPNYYFSNFDMAYLILPNSLKRIGEGAFSDCELLEKVIIPDSVTYIGPCAFNNCRLLEEIKLPKKLKVINNETFENASLKSIEFPRELEIIGTAAFYNSENPFHLINIILPPSVRIIGDSAFYNIKGSIELSSGIKYIGYDAFGIVDESERDNEISISNGVIANDDIKHLTPREDYRIEGKKLIINDGVKAVYGFSSSEDLKEIEEVVLPDSVVFIGQGVFDKQSIKKVRLSNNLEYIGLYAFKSCALERIKLPKSLKYIGEGNFIGAKAFIKKIKVPAGCLYDTSEDVFESEESSLNNLENGNNITTFSKILENENDELKEKGLLPNQISGNIEEIKEESRICFQEDTLEYIEKLFKSNKYQDEVDVDLIKSLIINHLFDVESLPYSIIRVVVSKGYINTLELFIRYGYNYSDIRVFNAAVAFNQLEIVKLLVMMGVNLNAGLTDEMTPLMIACKNGYVEMARYLINNGASKSTIDKYCRDAFYYAKESNNQELMELFHIEEPIDTIEIELNAMKLLLK